MLLVKTKLDFSKIDGIGLFADEFIPKNTIIWKYVSGFDLRFTKDEMINFPSVIQDYLKKYTYHSQDTGYYVLCSDDARFYNHSKNPNTKGLDLDGTDGEGADITIRDIQRGEEITSDYKKEWGEDISSWDKL